jgi:hypothetical protein
VDGGQKIAVMTELVSDYLSQQHDE